MLTALCDNGGHVDLLVVPPDSEADLAEAAMALAAAAASAHLTDTGPDGMRKVMMANKTNQKVNTKKQGRTLKEKRAAKKDKKAAKSMSFMPPTGH